MTIYRFKIDTEDLKEYCIVIGIIFLLWLAVNVLTTSNLEWGYKLLAGIGIILFGTGFLSVTLGKK